MRPKEKTLILDVGGANGAYLTSLYSYPEQIAVIDINFKALSRVKKSGVVLGNALTLPFDDNTFDIVWSNAVIEHVGNFPAQQQFAQEVRRVGQKYFVTCPWKGFPIEMHYKLPFYQFVPKKIQLWLSKYFAIGWYNKNEWEDINLLWLW